MGFYADPIGSPLNSQDSVNLLIPAVRKLLIFSSSHQVCLSSSENSNTQNRSPQRFGRCTRVDASPSKHFYQRRACLLQQFRVLLWNSSQLDVARRLCILFSVRENVVRLRGVSRCAFRRFQSQWICDSNQRFSLASRKTEHGLSEQLTSKFVGRLFDEE